MQRYDAWVEIWTSSDGPYIKFQDYAARNPRGAQRVLYQLGLLSQVLHDVEALKQSYGLNLDVNQQPQASLNRFSPSWVC